ncbi:MAG: hypothetical protein JWN48_4693 [Myxococcaceae bacterium]|nr:hypothetical protein [Myxococcaceae bacterium]
MKSGSLMGVALSILALAACDDGVAGNSESCRAFCDKLELCDDATDVLGCEQKCTEQRVRSEGYLAVRAQCANKLSCNNFAGEVSVMGEDSCASGELCKLDDCTNNELAEQKLTADQMSYCSRVVTKLNACDHTLDPATLQAHCLDLAPTLSPAYLADVSACIEGDCSQVSDCLRRTADRYDTNLTLLR